MRCNIDRKGCSLTQMVRILRPPSMLRLFLNIKKVAQTNGNRERKGWATQIQMLQGLPEKVFYANWVWKILRGVRPYQNTGRPRIASRYRRETKNEALWFEIAVWSCVEQVVGVDEGQVSNPISRPTAHGKRRRIQNGDFIPARKI